MSAADDKAREMVELIRCAHVNMDNVFKMYPAVAMACPHLRIVKHQIDCAAAISYGRPEPEIMP